MSRSDSDAGSKKRSDLTTLQKKYRSIADILTDTFGTPQWKPRYAPVDELVDCILSQTTTDANRDRAFAALKSAFPSWEAVRDAETADVVAAIRPAGLANQKGPRIQNALRYITQSRGSITLDFIADMDVAEAKAWLTAIDGIGPKTAAIVLCFAFGKPAFPVDTHIHRVSIRLGLIPEKMSADAAHDVLESLIPSDTYFPAHLNLISLGRTICKAQRPQCGICPLTEYCNYYQKLQATQKNTGRKQRTRTQNQTASAKDTVKP